MPKKRKETAAAKQGYMDYCAMGYERSLPGLFELYSKQTGEKPTGSLQTLKDWSTAHNWVERADKDDTDLAKRTLEKAKTDLVGERAKSLRAVNRALEAASGATGTAKVSDVKGLVETKHKIIGDSLAESFVHTGPGGGPIQMEHGVPDGQAAEFLANAAATVAEDGADDGHEEDDGPEAEGDGGGVGTTVEETG